MNLKGPSGQRRYHGSSSVVCWPLAKWPGGGMGCLSYHLLPGLDAWPFAQSPPRQITPPLRPCQCSVLPELQWHMFANTDQHSVTLANHTLRSCRCSFLPELQWHFANADQNSAHAIITPPQKSTIFSSLVIISFPTLQDMKAFAPPLPSAFSLGRLFAHTQTQYINRLAYGPSVSGLGQITMAVFTLPAFHSRGGSLSWTRASSHTTYMSL